MYLGTGRQCVSPAICTNSGINPNAGLSNYDNILNAMLINFMSITGEGWSMQMYYVFIKYFSN